MSANSSEGPPKNEAELSRIDEDDFFSAAGSVEDLLNQTSPTAGWTTSAGRSPLDSSSAETSPYEKTIVEVSHQEKSRHERSLLERSYQDESLHETSLVEKSTDEKSLHERSFIKKMRRASGSTKSDSSLWKGVKNFFGRSKVARSDSKKQKELTLDERTAEVLARADRLLSSNRGQFATDNTAPEESTSVQASGITPSSVFERIFGIPEDEPKMQEDFEAGQDTATVPFLEESTIDGPELDGTKDLRDETVQGAEQTTGATESVVSVPADGQLPLEPTFGSVPSLRGLERSNLLIKTYPSREERFHTTADEVKMKIRTTESKLHHVNDQKNPGEEHFLEIHQLRMIELLSPEASESEEHRTTTIQSFEFVGEGGMRKLDEIALQFRT